MLRHPGGGGQIDLGDRVHQEHTVGETTERRENPVLHGPVEHTYDTIFKLLHSIVHQELHTVNEATELRDQPVLHGLTYDTTFNLLIPLHLGGSCKPLSQSR